MDLYKFRSVFIMYYFRMVSS